MEDLKTAKLEELKAQLRYTEAMSEMAVAQKQYLEMMISIHEGLPVELVAVEGAAEQVIFTNRKCNEAHAAAATEVFRGNTLREVERFKGEAGVSGAVQEIKALLQAVQGATVTSWDLKKQASEPPTQDAPPAEEK